MGSEPCVYIARTWDADCADRLKALLEGGSKARAAVLDATGDGMPVDEAGALARELQVPVVRVLGPKAGAAGLRFAAGLFGGEAPRFVDLAGSCDPAPAEPHGESPLVSVLIPLYQAGAYAAESVESALAQTVRDFELIVVDDGSDDDGAAHALAALEARDLSGNAVVVRMPHRGQAASRNTALSLSSGQWVFYLDADDVLEPDALGVLLAAAGDNPAADMVCSKCIDFISPDLTEQEAAKLKVNPQPYQRMLAGCLLVSHGLYDCVGPYDESLPSSETAQWMLRAKDAGAVMACIDAVTLRRRYHRSNFGRRDRATQLASYMQIIKQRRAKGGGS